MERAEPPPGGHTRPRDVVIDLGLLAPEGAGRPRSDAAAAVRAWWGRRRRGLAGGLVTALVLITAVASAPQPGDSVVTIVLPPTGYGRFDVVGDTLFLAETNTRWRAYELPAGVPGWSLERPDDAPLGLVVSDGLLLDRLYGAFGTTRDPTTGSVLLSLDQLEVSTGVTNVQVLTGADTALAAGDYRYYRDASPHPRFARRATGRLAGWLAGDPPVIVRVSTGGLVELRAPATGAVLTRRYLPLRGTGIGLAAVFEDTLVLQDGRSGRLRLQGYELGTLAPVDARTGRSLRQLAGWRAIVPVAGGDPGPLILMRTEHSGQTTLARLDLASLALTEVAVLPGTPGPCQSFSQGLVCRHAHLLRVWTL